MTWQRLLAEKRIKQHQTSASEIADLGAVVDRDLQDAQVEALSPDRRFATAYNAILHLTKTVIACSGYRLSGAGHHKTVFEALELAMGKDISNQASYFDTRRIKRNTVEYDMVEVISIDEAEEIIKEAVAFKTVVQSWISQNHPNLPLSP